MAWELIETRSGQFAVDWGVIHRLLRSHYTAKLQFSYGREIRISESTWYNPLSWSLPDIAHVEVDWDLVRRDTDSRAKDHLEYLQRRVTGEPGRVGRELDGLLDEAGHCKEQYIDWIGDVQTENMHRINQAVADYESNVEVARFFRDRSVDGLMVGASLMTGGAATAWMAGGSILKGTGKFEDTGSIGAGVMEAVGSFTFARVKLGKKFSLKQDMVLSLFQAPWKFGTELVAGKGLGEAALSGAVKLTGPPVERLVAGPGKWVLDRVALPVQLTYGDKGVTADFTAKFAGKVAQQFGVEKVGKGALVGKPKPQAAPQPASTRSPIIDQTTLTNKLLLYLAYVNMNLGIGRGW